MPRRCGAGVCGLVHPLADQSSSDPVSSSAYTPEHTGRLHYQHNHSDGIFHAIISVSQKNRKICPAKCLQVAGTRVNCSTCLQIHGSGIGQFCHFPFQQHPIIIKTHNDSSADHSVKKRKPSTIFFADV